MGARKASVDFACPISILTFKSNLTFFSFGKTNLFLLSGPVPDPGPAMSMFFSSDYSDEIKHGSTIQNWTDEAYICFFLLVSLSVRDVKPWGCKPASASALYGELATE